MSGRMVDTVQLWDRVVPDDGDQVAPGSAIEALWHGVLERKTELARSDTRVTGCGLV